MVYTFSICDFKDFSGPVGMSEIIDGVICAEGFGVG